MEKNCNLLYKQKLRLWVKNQKECGKFHTRDIDLVAKVIPLSDYPLPHNWFLTDQPIGHYLQFNDLDRSKLEILRMTDCFYGTITMFKLDGCQQTLCTEVSKKLKLLNKFVQDVKKKLKKEPEPGTLVGLVRGSLNGKFFLGYSEYGYLFLMNLDTSTGSLIGRWPINLHQWTVRVNGAVSRDGSLVAVLSQKFDPPHRFAGVPDYNTNSMLRVYDTKSRQYHTTELPFHPVITIVYQDFFNCPCDSVLSFNPFNHNLLYFMATFGRKDSPVLTDMEADDFQLVLYDLREKKIFATRREFLLTSYMGSTLGYEDVEGPVFLHHGEIIIVYHLDRFTGYHVASWQCDYIGLLDAFSLDTVATVNLPRLIYLEDP